MKILLSFIVSVTCLFSYYKLFSSENDYLKQCREKQVEALNEQFVELSFSEVKNTLYSSMYAWQPFTAHKTGKVWAGIDNYYKLDTIIGTEYISKTQLTNTDFLYLSYGDTTLTQVSKDQLIEQAIENARYSPIGIIEYFYSQNPEPDPEISDTIAVYSLKINKNITRIFINKSNSLLTKMTVLNYDEYYGDVLTTFYFDKYEKINDLYYPVNIFIDKINSHAKDTIIINSGNFVEDVKPLLVKPEDFTWKEVQDIKYIPKTTVESFGPYLTFINFVDIHVRVLVVNFQEFLMVIGAPLSSDFGERIIYETGLAFKDLPIKYFSYGHRCKWVLGGLRPFIHKEATILYNTEKDREFIEYMVNTPRELEPDSLQFDPRRLKLELIKDSMTIKTKFLEMKIYLIGETSAHTDDFMLYYFPQQRVLWEEDLAWINNGEIKKAGKRQEGLYKAIQNLKLDVETIIQSWGINNENVKTVFPYSDLEKSINIK